MGDLVNMPRRPQRNPDEDDVIDIGEEHQQPKKRKKKGFPSWLKWTGAVAAGSIVGGLAMRKWDQVFPPGNKNPEEIEGNPPQGTLPAATPGFNIPVFNFGGHGPAAAPQSNPPRKRRRSVGELQAELRQRKQEERAQRVSKVEEAWWEDED